MTTYADLVNRDQTEKAGITELIKTLPKPKAKGVWIWSVSDRRTALLTRKHNRMVHPYALLMRSTLVDKMMLIGIMIDGAWVWPDEEFSDIDAAAARICELAEQRVEHDV